VKNIQPTIQSSRLAAEDSNRGRSVLAIETELDEASEVVLNGRSTRILATNTASRHVGTRGTLGGRVVSGEHKLDLTEGTASGDDSLTHILQETSGRTADRGKVRVPRAVVRNGRPGRRREGALCKRTTRTSARGERIDDTLEGGEGHVVALFNVKLLNTSLEGSHLFIPVI